MRSIPAWNGEFDNRPIYSELLSFASEQPYTFEEMRQASSIIDKINSSETDILVEEAEYEFVLKRISLARFVRVDRNVMGAIEAVRDARKVNVTVKKGR